MSEVTDLAVSYPANRFTVMAVQEDLASHDHVRYECVAVQIDAKQTKRGDVHMIDGGCYLAKNAVDRIAVALGIIFDPDRTNVDKLSRTEWVGRAVAARRNPDGSWQIRTGEYEWGRGAARRDRRQGRRAGRWPASPWSTASTAASARRRARSRGLSGR